MPARRTSSNIITHKQFARAYAKAYNDMSDGLFDVDTLTRFILRKKILPEELVENLNNKHYVLKEPEELYERDDSDSEAEDSEDEDSDSDDEYDSEDDSESDSEDEPDESKNNRIRITVPVDQEDLSDSDDDSDDEDGDEWFVFWTDVENKLFCALPVLDPPEESSVWKDEDWKELQMIKERRCLLEAWSKVRTRANLPDTATPWKKWDMVNMDED